MNFKSFRLIFPTEPRVYRFAGPTPIASRLRVKEKNHFPRERERGRYIETPFHSGCNFICTGPIDPLNPVLKCPWALLSNCTLGYIVSPALHLSRERETMASASEKVWHQDILDDPDIGSIDKLNCMCIFFQVCTKKVNMKYSFRVSIWNEHGKTVSRLESKLKQEHSKSGETEPLKQSSIISFISDFFLH